MWNDLQLVPYNQTSPRRLVLLLTFLVMNHERRGEQEGLFCFPVPDNYRDPVPYFPGAMNSDPQASFSLTV
jgi:hypothetical protein